MDFKNKLKNFWRLNAQSAKGFTLVELIVVIAILAILAGIAVPAYSGYVEKANKAADEQLLANVNQAFAAACASNGEDHYGRNDVSITLTGEDGAKKVDVVTVTGIIGFDGYFDEFYKDGEFKVINGLYYDPQIGGFEEGISIIYNGTSITLSNIDIQNLKDSSFAEIGADKLLTMVDMASGMIDITNASSALTQLATSDAATSFLYEKLGITNGEEIYGLLEEEYPQGDMSDDEWNALLDEKYNQVIANSAVLYAAQNSQSASENIWEVLNATNVKETIKNNADTEEQLAQAAMAFAMYSAYTKTDSLEGVELDDVYNTLDSTEFKAYLATIQAQDDLDGYLSAMNMVNDGVSSDPTAAQSILLNGFSDEELANLMSQLIGN